MRDVFHRRGWVRLPHANDVFDWATAAREAARASIAAPEHAHWLQCQGTWFVGVDALPNTPDGNVAGAAFPASLSDAITKLGLPQRPFHKAQLSVIYPGYPRPRDGESDAAFRYRRNRDAAHLDGLLPVGPERRRMLKEPHAYILGIPLTQASETASPMVIWEGSHRVLRDALWSVLQDQPHWSDVDLTDTYQAARRRVFEDCPRVAVTAKPGEAYIVHRLALHGVAPWAEDAHSDPEGRIIAYFRPELAPPHRTWLSEP